MASPTPKPTQSHNERHEASATMNETSATMNETSSTMNEASGTMNEASGTNKTSASGMTSMAPAGLPDFCATLRGPWCRTA